MAINLQIYDNTTKRTNTITIDFVNDYLSTSTGNDPNEMQYFFKVNTGALDTSGLSYSIRYVTDLSDLALNDQKQSATNTAAAYSDINAMIKDYVYDTIYGHVLDQFSSGCKLKAPMNF